MNLRIICLVVILSSKIAINAAEPVAESNQQISWPQFRGPLGNGHASYTNLPTQWSEDENIKWKTAVPGSGWSSPVVHRGRIWLTAAVDDGHALHLVGLDLQSGRLRTNTLILKIADPGRIHPKNSHASPTVVAENAALYLHFGTYGTARVSIKELDKPIIDWKTRMKYYHRHGPAGSPVIWNDKLIFACDGFPRPRDRESPVEYDVLQYVVALNKKSGNVIWKTDRKRPRFENRAHAYSTPIVINVNDQTQLISVGANRVVAYEPDTGQEIWSCRFKGYSVVPRPVFWNPGGQQRGLILFSTGYDVPVLYAVHPDGKGDVTDTHIAWTTKRGAPLNPSPLLIENELYLVNDRGIMSCLDATTGDVHWMQRLGGNYSASPLFVDSKIYVQSEQGVTHVVSPGKTYKPLATNTLPGRTLASFAAIPQALLIRTDTHLYRVEEP